MCDSNENIEIPYQQQDPQFRDCLTQTLPQESET